MKEKIEKMINILLEMCQIYDRIQDASFDEREVLEETLDSLEEQIRNIIYDLWVNKNDKKLAKLKKIRFDIFNNEPDLDDCEIDDVERINNNLNFIIRVNDWFHELLIEL